MLGTTIKDKIYNLPLRVKFILSFFLVIIAGGVVTLFFGTRLEHRTIISMAQDKVKHDLDSAWMVYNEKLKDIEDIVSMSSKMSFIKNAFLKHDFNNIKSSLKKIKSEYKFDILTIIDAEGLVLLRTSETGIKGDDQSNDPLIKKALEGKTVKAAEIISRNELLKEGKDIADRAHMTVIKTAKAAPLSYKVEENGMVLKAASPIIDENQNVIGVLYGAILLNRNYEIVDQVKDIVFKGEKYKGREIGTVTIFQHDLRISTNVMDKDGLRAIGTSVSQEVKNAVLIEGNHWIDRAFVVDDWYITAYEPIKNYQGSIIGILYVGMLEKPYIDLRNNVMLTFTIMAAIFVIILLGILFFITSTIIKPLNSMVIATNKIAQGDLDHKVNIDQGDELGQLAKSFNKMTKNLNIANKKLVQWGKTLEKRVEERSKKLKDMQDTLVQSEKMASLGRLAAGIAHEINNPLTSILINSHLIREKTDSKSPIFENLNLITEETERCSNIVKGLLDFSRLNPQEKQFADINDVITTTLNILKNQAAFQNTHITTFLSNNLPPLEIDKDKIKQVFLNLMINSAEAMPDGGQLTVRSMLSEDNKYIKVEFADTGIGIPEKYLNKLFDPFFTTKSGGTGLGLAISFGIINQHKGNIKVKSKPSQGSTFTISLPVPD
jgi:two-component system NtrC family sensor kinase